MAKVIKISFIRDYSYILDCPEDDIDTIIEQAKQEFDRDYLDLSPDDTDCYTMKIEIIKEN